MKNVWVISGHTDLQHDSFNNKSYYGGLGYVNRDDAEACKAMESAAHEHAQRVINRIEELAK